MIMVDSIILLISIRRSNLRSRFVIKTTKGTYTSRTSANRLKKIIPTQIVANLTEVWEGESTFHSVIFLRCPCLMPIDDVKPNENGKFFNWKVSGLVVIFNFFSTSFLSSIIAVFFSHCSLKPQTNSQINREYLLLFFVLSQFQIQFLFYFLLWKVFFLGINSKTFRWIFLCFMIRVCLA